MRMLYAILQRTHSESGPVAMHPPHPNHLVIEHGIPVLVAEMRIALHEQHLAAPLADPGRDVAEADPVRGADADRHPRGGCHAEPGELRAPRAARRDPRHGDGEQARDGDKRGRRGREARVETGRLGVPVEVRVQVQVQHAEADGRREQRLEQVRVDARQQAVRVVGVESPGRQDGQYGEDPVHHQRAHGCFLKCRRRGVLARGHLQEAVPGEVVTGAEKGREREYAFLCKLLLHCLWFLLAVKVHGRSGGRRRKSRGQEAPCVPAWKLTPRGTECNHDDVTEAGYGHESIEYALA